MTKSNEGQIQMNYKVSPGEIIAEYIEASGITQHQLAVDMKMSDEDVDKLITGKMTITPDIANELAVVLARPAHFWLHLECLFSES